MLEDDAEAPLVPKDITAVWSDEGRILEVAGRDTR